ncbi:MAG TPA: RimK/LysX family protein, partial [Gammaproteobacteria bacterium]
VKTSEGKELRYKVPLTIKWKSTRKTVLVTLNDRRSMSYPFLLGRNWLQNDFLVDVELNGDD